MSALEEATRSLSAEVDRLAAKLEKQKGRSPALETGAKEASMLAKKAATELEEALAALKDLRQTLGGHQPD